MRRFTYALVAGLTAFALLPVPALADQKLTALEIHALLDGRTALGNWRGTDTRQYFAPSGSTTYLEKGGIPDVGRWRVDEAKNQYCSWWERGGWSCYDVETDGATYYWVSPGSAYRSPFTMTDGRQMDF